VIDVLRQVDLFSELSDACLGRLAAAAHEERHGAGEWLVTEGSRADRFGILTEGLIEWVRMVDGEEVVLGSRAPITYFGAMNLLTEEPAMAGGRTVTDSVLVMIPGDEFRRLLRDEPSVMRGAVRVIAPMFQGVQAALREREKLIALGTLSAGLAHELNNPAAAARRSAGELERVFQVLHDAIHGFVSSGVERAQAQELVALQREALDRAVSAAAPTDDVLASADREEALVDALEADGLEGWRLAPPLADAGLDPEWLDRLRETAGPALGVATEWIAASLSARGLAQELHESTARISEIVGAVKDYTHMDQAHTQSIDVHDGLESTLTMLAHKLKKGAVKVERAYDRALPRVTAHGSQLNQVWTNLIDNAIDAVDGAGTVRISTRRTGDHVVVEIGDDGPGVPAELQNRVFEPFFTTKDVGKGTGLGLDVVHRIVTNHRGQVRVQSSPGDTRFEVRLPIDGPEPAG
jgi:signal transduction histidine kinase